MQSPQDLVCSECKGQFKSAAALLQHYAGHALSLLTEGAAAMETTPKKPKLPDLYPISLKARPAPRSDTDVESDSGVEDVNPMKFCVVTMRDDKKSPATPRKYQCTYCSKRFGWSTDLKRHILTHTGEKPFACGLCDSAFTRNFLLLKHQKKCHDGKPAPIPELKPLVVTKSRKQDKARIQRRALDVERACPGT